MASTFDARDRGETAGTDSVAADGALCRLHHRMLAEGPQPFATIGLDRRLNYVNDAFLALLGYDRDELLGTSVVDLTAPEDRDATLAAHERILAGGRASIVKRYRRKDGRCVPVELLIDSSRDDEGRVVGFFAFITEVSQRIQAEEAVAASERWVRTIFEGIHDAVLVHDESGEILDANPAAAELLGYEPGELVGMAAAAIDDAGDFRERLDRASKAGPLTLEGACRTKSGRTIPVEITTSTIEFDGRTAVLAILRDVTERIALERTRRRFAEVQMRSAKTLEAKNRELSQSEERYRRLTEGSLDAIVVADGGARITLFNPAAEAVFGYDARRVIGEPLELLIPTTAPAAVEAAEAGPPEGFDLASVLNKTVELSGRRRDGTAFPIEMSLGSVEADGRIEYVASIRDQTERQRMRAMLAHTDKLASIGLLSAGVAHEINNPLSYVGNNLAVLRRDVKGLLEMLIEGQRACEAVQDIRPDEFRRIREIAEEIDWPYIRENLEPMIDRTLEGVRRVAGIVQKMRGLARTSRPRWEKASLAELVESALEMTRGRLRRDRIEMVVETGDVDRIDCVPSDISQVLLNLVINALQAVEAAGRGEGGRIEIAARHVGDWVEIGIADNGLGIEPGDLGRLFDPFFTTKPVGEGTGLGLAISHGIITGHGGRIEVDTEPGRGTTFRVLLPRERDRAAPG